MDAPCLCAALGWLNPFIPELTFAPVWQRNNVPSFSDDQELAASKAAVPGWERKIQSEGWKERSSCWKCCWGGGGVAQGGMWNLEIFGSHELGTPACLMVSCWNTKPLLQEVEPWNPGMV